MNDDYDMKVFRMLCADVSIWFIGVHVGYWILGG